MDRVLPVTVVLPYLIFGGFLSAGFYCAVQLIRLEAQREAGHGRSYTDLCFWLLIASIIGGRLAGLLESDSAEPVHFLYFWRGGSFYHGGLPAAVAVGLMFLYKYRMPIWKTADAFAPATACGYFFVHAGCFYSGLCHRSPSRVETLLDSTANMPPLDAIELFLAGGSLLAFFALLKLRGYKQFEGQVFWTAMLFAGLLRGIAEGLYTGFPQTHPAAPVNTDQLSALAVMLVAAAMLAWLGSRRKE